MNGLGVFGWIAGALQLIVPSYAFRLVRRFGTPRVGWFIVTAFVSLTLLHMLEPMKRSGARLDIVYAIGSVLLLIGMGHVETLFSEREQAQRIERTLRKKWESKLKEETAGLSAAKEELVQELARRDVIEAALRDSKAQYRFLFTENPQPMWIQDLRSCRFHAVNHAALQQYGFTSEEFMALTGRDLLLPSLAAAFLQDTVKPCAQAESRGVWKHCTKDGTFIDVEITALDVQYAGLPSRLMVATDITQQRRRDLKIRKAHRLEVMAQVAGGVAHHFNNLLALIEGSIAELLTRPLDLKSAKQLEHIRVAITRTTGLTHQLLAAAGRQPMRPEPVDLNGLIRNLNPMLQHLLGEQVALENIYGSALPPILADHRLVEHAIVSLVLNGREAMPRGGTLNIRTTKVHVDNEEADRDPQARTGDFVRLDVRDSGCGMTPQVQSRLFESFFTTRDPGKGTGLGLASVYGVVSQHSGWIDFTSDVGVGTEFRIFLPSAPASTSLTEAESRSATSAVKGTILLVEAEEQARALARFVLNHQGYRVIEADGSATALVLWEGQASNVDLLLTGLNLPGDISGRELADRLRQTKPELKVIYATESSSTAEGKDAAVPEGAHFVSKPCNPGTLLQAVQVLLDGCG